LAEHLEDSPEDLNRPKQLDTIPGSPLSELSRSPTPVNAYQQQTLAGVDPVRLGIAYEIGVWIEEMPQEIFQAMVCPLV